MTLSLVIIVFLSISQKFYDRIHRLHSQFVTCIKITDLPGSRCKMGNLEKEGVYVPGSSLQFRQSVNYLVYVNSPWLSDPIIHNQHWPKFNIKFLTSDFIGSNILQFSWCQILLRALSEKVRIQYQILSTQNMQKTNINHFQFKLW